jgi:GH25 family lysozyme M1 (1,4-beta-N-acetylmuramidase)
MLKGVDVSKHNGKIDWQKVKNSGEVDFALLRAARKPVANSDNQRL